MCHSPLIQRHFPQVLAGPIQTQLKRRDATPRAVPANFHRLDMTGAALNTVGAGTDVADRAGGLGLARTGEQRGVAGLKCPPCLGP